MGNVSKKRGKSLNGETGVVSNRDRNLSIEPKKEPPSREREREAAEAEKILAAYPPDRLRGESACLGQIEVAMKEGTTPAELLQTVQAYATDSAGFTRSKVCFSDNWFQWRRGQRYIIEISVGRKGSPIAIWCSSLWGVLHGSNYEHRGISSKARDNQRDHYSCCFQKTCRI